MDPGLTPDRADRDPDPTRSSAAPSAAEISALGLSSSALEPLDLSRLEGLVVVAIGTDLVDIDRMRAVIARQPACVERVFTPYERAYCDRRNDPAERYAARFAAKEAVLKVLGTGLGGADFDEIEVVRLESGKPELRVVGRAQAKADELGIRRWLITISHSEHLAQVFVAGLGQPPDRADAQ
ncbi:MAG: holo-ACP synthase [Acidimicrobiales bacterium]